MLFLFRKKVPIGRPTLIPGGTLIRFLRKFHKVLFYQAVLLLGTREYSSAPVVLCQGLFTNQEEKEAKVGEKHSDI